MKITIESRELEFMYWGYMRYCYGRHSTAPWGFQMCTKEVFPQLSKVVQNQILEELTEDLVKETPETMSEWDRADYDTWVQTAEIMRQNIKKV